MKAHEYKAKIDALVAAVDDLALEIPTVFHSEWEAKKLAAIAANEAVKAAGRLPVDIPNAHYDHELHELWFGYHPLYENIEAQLRAFAHNLANSCIRATSLAEIIQKHGAEAVFRVIEYGADAILTDEEHEIRKAIKLHLPMR